MILKRKKKKIHIEVLRLEYDFASKILLIVNAIFILYLAQYKDTADKILNSRTNQDWWLLITILIMVVAEVWIMKMWFKTFLDLRNELEK